ncbi:integral membrane protein, putative [Theileria annulata]|uniref:Integral membrane protein, putative n=1 Tax=Theileria annulata TaxID=5874 RepID=Q4UGB8_THEAN|nr:integral membrane protein, putative [Theileria annulata]CAI73871.1 integral membrane protein, putative [Theileria annulata]|eukprot:XP_954548.1 integral membrane protein, putative [Theileria annulata]
MLKFLRKFIFFTSFSIFLYLLSYCSNTFTNSLISNPSFYHLSTLVDKFDQKIEQLNFYSLNHSLKSFHKPLLVIYTEVIGVDSNSYFYYLLRIVFRLFFLVFVQLYVFYILLFRYGQLFKDLLDLSYKSLKQINWKSPINFFKSFYLFVHYVISLFLYYNSLVSVRVRLILYSSLVFVISIMSFKVGIGTKHFVNTTPIIIGLTTYLSILLTFTPAICQYLTLLNTILIPAWALTIYLRSQPNTSNNAPDEGSVVTSKRSKLTRTKSNISHKSDDNMDSMNVSNVRLFYELNNCLDLYLIIVMVRICKSIPFFGKLLQLNFYLSHISLFFTISIVVHFCIVYITGITVIRTPLSGVRNLILLTLNWVIFHTFGISNYFSKGSKSTLNTTLAAITARIKQVLTIFLGKYLEPLNQHKAVMVLLTVLRTLPQLCLLLLPPLFSSLYFEYSTVLVPISTFLIHDNTFKDKLYCMGFFVLSDATRYLFNYLGWISFKRTLRITLLVFLSRNTLYLQAFPVDQMEYTNSSLRQFSHPPTNNILQ